MANISSRKNNIIPNYMPRKFFPTRTTISLYYSNL